ncbi:alpha-ketoglutaric semialdehyde dehydrogenase GucD [Geomicrobium sp. JCM 19038]|uniref:alpha-ketoglutaric semialdehyde dehydrogenase GucD n=1 Tax=Geomicrobium sp. JCM 19038 TaxID=1460635 RepID=UPI00045F4447|nr:alpha-ketoglutaric semialdehyde dehydrogenase GucD [Geomicrobium sp. JCM 19038]GAK09895.1 ketoglutarate semialdehyde dehydrogenase [Geomicrobium sp. JCM 19038]
MITVTPYINAKWETKQQPEHTVINPGNVTDTVGQVTIATEEEVNEAVRAAKNAQAHWASLAGASRGEYLYKAASELNSRAEEIAQIASREMGKTITETKGEVQRGVSILRYYANEGMRAVGDVIPATDSNALMFTTRAPLGVVGVITPWNFPVAIPLWKLAPALIYGNTVVIKPALETSITCAKIMECFSQADLPEGVLNMVSGGREVGSLLTEHQDVSGITFTGSNTAGKEIGATALARGAKYQLEMGGKNPVIVCEDADLELAVSATISGAFKTTGQKCTATSRVIVHENVYEQFKKKLVAQTEEIIVGDSLDESTWMGPFASEPQLRKSLAYIEKGVTEGGSLLTGGSQLYEERGFYMQPTIFENLAHSSSLAQEEIFGPVITLFKVDDLSEAIELANDSDYGLSASIFTSNIGGMMSFIDDMNAGLVRINAESAGVELQAPFGGMKNSSSHSREQGEAAKEFFTNIKTVFVKA